MPPTCESGRRESNCRTVACTVALHCRLHCRIEPYLDQGGAAARRRWRTRTGLCAWGARPVRVRRVEHQDEIKSISLGSAADRAIPPSCPSWANLVRT